MMAHLFTTFSLFFPPAYSQAPVSMKSVCQAAWLLTSAIGNVIVIVVAASNLFTNRALELFFFAFLMLFCMVAFVSLARKHTYAEDLQTPAST